VALQVQGPVSETLHQAIGLALLAVVCAAVVAVMHGGRHASA
jgi:hypothetical protein